MIATKVGDGGMTLVNERWVQKTDTLVCALGDLDEAISSIVLAIAQNDVVPELMFKVISDLHDIGSYLCRYLLTFDGTSRIMEMEKLIYSKEIFDFTYPTENLRAAQLNFARSVVRRAERSVLKVLGSTPEFDEADKERVRKYLNRLSDYLFALSLEERDL